MAVPPSVWAHPIEPCVAPVTSSSCWVAYQTRAGVNAAPMATSVGQVRPETREGAPELEDADELELDELVDPELLVLEELEEVEAPPSPPTLVVDDVPAPPPPSPSWYLPKS